MLGAREHGPWRRLLLEVLAGRPSHERHFGEFVSLVEELADRWGAQTRPNDPGDGGGAPVVALQKDLTALSLRMICAYALGGDGLDGVVDPDAVVDAFEVALAEYLGKMYRAANEGEDDSGAAECFTTAVSQLGENSTAMRLGGVHALAGLADVPTDLLPQTCAVSWSGRGSRRAGRRGVWAGWS